MLSTVKLLPPRPVPEAGPREGLLALRMDPLRMEIPLPGPMMLPGLPARLLPTLADNALPAGA